MYQKRCQAVSKFCEAQDHMPQGNLRVAYYYCSESATGTNISRPDTEIVLRSLCRKLALLPTADIAPEAKTFCSEFSADSNNHPAFTDWEQLFGSLINGAVSPVLLIIDALDERTEPYDLVKCLAKCVQSNSNLYLMLSSRHHVLVDTYFQSDMLSQIDTTAGKKELDMDVFTQTAIELRKRDAETKESVFCKCVEQRRTLLTDPN